MKIIRTFLVSVLLCTTLFSQDWTFLNTKRSGAADFIRKNPAWDGRGVVIFVLDTGVDMGIPGLTMLPDGTPKVIDVQDFSGEGDVFLEPAEKGTENNEMYLQHSSGLRLFGYTGLNLLPAETEILIGFLNEEDFKDATLGDFNSDGDRTDRFGVIAANTTAGWVAFTDLDADGNIDDESPLWNYKEKKQAFTFRGRDKMEQSNPATFGLNIFPDENRVNFHFDGGAHGSHVAGIAAGFQINDQQGLNGIAPGARVVSLKIGDGRLSGGATTTGSMVSAYEYGLAFAKEYDGPVVFNMSFGIGSEMEGLSEIDYTLDELAKENPNVLFVTSAGNEGPGLSTVGTPAAGQHLLTVGALMTASNARDLYEATIGEDKIYYFSSRGGEIPKPDVLAPGAAASTVPPVFRGDVMRGTSMASPQTAGAVALLMSAAWQEGLPINGPMIKKAFKNSARPLPGYAVIEQGSGVIQVQEAYELYKSYIRAGEQHKLNDYEVNTLSPFYSSRQGSAAYWRYGTWFPDEKEKQTFRVRPIFSADLDADARRNFYRAFTLQADQPWIKLTKKNTYIHGDQPAVVDVFFDPQLIRKPGLYSGKISAYAKGLEFGQQPEAEREFELFCTVIVPVTFSESNQHYWNSGDLNIAAGDLQRIFFDVPAGATAASIQIHTADNDFAHLRTYLHDPEGQETDYMRFQSQRAGDGYFYLSGDELKPGIWELVLYSDYANEKNSKCSASIQFLGLEIQPAVVKSLQVRNGQDPSGQFTVHNHFANKYSARIGGEISGYARRLEINDDGKLYEHDITVGGDIDLVDLELELSKDVYNYLTDFAVNIKDMDGNTVASDGFSNRRLKLSFAPQKAGDYILELIPAFTAKNAKPWEMQVTEKHFRKNPLSVQGGTGNFYPKISEKVHFSIGQEVPVVPAGFFLFGEIVLKSAGPRQFQMTIPVEVRTYSD